MTKDPMDLVLADEREPGIPPRDWSQWSDEDRAAYARTHLTPEEWQQARTNITKAMVQLITYFPFFGFAVSSMATHRVWLTERHPSMSNRTMATDGKRLYIWPQFALYHPTKMLMGVLLHELFHNILSHPARGAGYDPVLRNMAMDFAVNLMVNDAALEAKNHPAGALTPDDYGSVEWYIPTDIITRSDGSKGPRYCIDEQYRTADGQPMLWEDIYELLLAEAKGQCTGACASGVPGSGPPCPSCARGAGQLVDDHTPWHGDRPADEDGSVNSEKFDPEDVRRWMLDANARNTDKMMGSVPAGIKRKIDEWLNPPLPWYRLLQAYMKLVPHDVAWAPGDIRFPEPMPWISERPEITYITFGFDTSGSMSTEEISASVSNAQAILRAFPGMKGRAYFWDAEVHDRFDLEDFTGEVKNGVRGGGGTSIAPQFKAIADDRIEDRTSVHVCFTDGYVDWQSVDPERLAYDVIWVITNDTQNAPDHPRYRQTRLEVTRP